MDVREIRYSNFQHLFAQFKENTRKDDPGAPEKGMLKLFGERLGIRQAYMSHIHTKYKGIGETTARLIEQALGLPRGWMDQAHDKQPAARVEAQSTEGSKQVEPTDADELEFLETAIKLYRQDPLRAQSALMRVLASRYDK